MNDYRSSMAAQRLVEFVGSDPRADAAGVEALTVGATRIKGERTHSSRALIALEQALLAEVYRDRLEPDDFTLLSSPLRRWVRSRAVGASRNAEWGLQN